MLNSFLQMALMVGLGLFALIVAAATLGFLAAMGARAFRVFDRW